MNYLALYLLDNIIQITRCGGGLDLQFCRHYEERRIQCGICFEIVHAPKHGSWLNASEVELNAMDPPVPEQARRPRRRPARRARRQQDRRDRSTAMVNWQFTSDDARVTEASLSDIGCVTRPWRHEIRHPDGCRVSPPAQAHLSSRALIGTTRCSTAHAPSPSSRSPACSPSRACCGRTQRSCGPRDRPGGMFADA